jgi:hypothetical protein
MKWKGWTDDDIEYQLATVDAGTFVGYDDPIIDDYGPVKAIGTTDRAEKVAASTIPALVMTPPHRAGPDSWTCSLPTTSGPATRSVAVLALASAAR